jgi:hypothetical protein
MTGKFASDELYSSPVESNAKSASWH